MLPYWEASILGVAQLQVELLELSSWGPFVLPARKEVLADKFWKCRLWVKAAAVSSLMRLRHIQDTDSSLMKHIINLVLKGWLSMPAFWRAVYSCLVCCLLLLFLPSRMSLYLKGDFLMSYFAAEGKMTNADINISSLGFLLACNVHCNSQALFSGRMETVCCQSPRMPWGTFFYCKLLWFIALFWTHIHWSLLGILLSSEVLGNEDICYS